MINYKNRYLLSIIAFTTFSFGLALQIKADIGQSMMTAFGLAFADLFYIKVGTALNIINISMFVIDLILKKFEFKKTDLIQLIATYANGILVNIFVYDLLGTWTLDSIVVKYVVFFIGVILAPLSLGLMVSYGIIQFPLESLCLTISKIANKTVSFIRYSFDVVLLALCLILLLVPQVHLYIREGSIISFLLLSYVFGKSFDYFKKQITTNK